MPTLSIRGASLEYVERGSRGSPVLLVHGSASDYRTWQAQMDALAARHQVVAYSRRYHWPNAPLPAGADYSMREHVDDLEAVLRSLEAPPHLVGHSYGAFLCLLAAMRDPALVRSLVLGEPPVITLFVSLPPKPSELLPLLLRRPRTALAIIRFAATGMRPTIRLARRGELKEAMRVFGGAVLRPEVEAALSPERQQQVRANTFAAEFLGSGFLPVRDDEVRAMTVPTLLVRGAISPPVFQRVSDRLEELLPNATCVTIDAASHNMHEGNPSAFNDAVLRFVAAHGGD